VGAPHLGITMGEHGALRHMSPSIMTNGRTHLTEILGTPYLEFSCEGLKRKRCGVDTCDGQVGHDDPKNRCDGWLHQDLSETHNMVSWLVRSTSLKGHDC